MSDMKCVLCENKAYFSLYTKSLFNYNTDAFVVDGVYCFGCYCTELMRIHNGLRSTMTPDYKALSRTLQEVEGAGTVTVMQEPEADLVKETDAILKENEKLEKIHPTEIRMTVQAVEESLPKYEKAIELLNKPKPELNIIKMSPALRKQLAFEEEVKHAILEKGLDDSYEIARYLHRPRGSVYNCIKRLGLRDKLKHAGRSNRKSYNSLPENAK